LLAVTQLLAMRFHGLRHLPAGLSQIREGIGGAGVGHTGDGFSGEVVDHVLRGCHLLAHDFFRLVVPARHREQKAEVSEAPS
jgi:hypothetical protein